MRFLRRGKILLWSKKVSFLSRTLLNLISSPFLTENKKRKKIKFFYQKSGLTPFEKYGFWDFEKICLYSQKKFVFYHKLYLAFFVLF